MDRPGGTLDGNKLSTWTMVNLITQKVTMPNPSELQRELDCCDCREQLGKLLAVIHDVHQQIADDICWMDIDRIFTAAGLAVPDRRVGDPQAMLVNCQRFVSTLCQGGKWRSYVELEQENQELRRLLQPFAL